MSSDGIIFLIFSRILTHSIQTICNLTDYCVSAIVCRFKPVHIMVMVWFSTLLQGPTDALRWKWYILNFLSIVCTRSYNNIWLHNPHILMAKAGGAWTKLNMEHMVFSYRFLSMTSEQTLNSEYVYINHAMVACYGTSTLQALAFQIYLYT